MPEKPSRNDFVVSRLRGVGVRGGTIVLWVIFRGGKHVKKEGFARKNDAARRAKELARRARVRYWVEGTANRYDMGNGEKN